MLFRRFFKTFLWSFCYACINKLIRHCFFQIVLFYPNNYSSPEPIIWRSLKYLLHTYIWNVLYGSNQLSLMIHMIEMLYSILFCVQLVFKAFLAKRNFVVSSTQRKVKLESSWEQTCDDVHHSVRSSTRDFSKVIRRRQSKSLKSSWSYGVSDLFLRLSQQYTTFLWV